MLNKQALKRERQGKGHEAADGRSESPRASHAGSVEPSLRPSADPYEVTLVHVICLKPEFASLPYNWGQACFASGFLGISSVLAQYRGVQAKNRWTQVGDFAT